jgi:hypothetical protein
MSENKQIAYQTFPVCVAELYWTFSNNLMFYGTLSKLSSLKLPSTSRRTIQCLLQAKLGGMNNEKKIPERSKTYTVYNFVEI